MKLFLVAMTLCFGAAVAWDNDWDGMLFKVCPIGYSFKRIRSVHDNYREDRRYQFDCTRDHVSSYRCYWTNHVNNYDGRMNFNCNSNHVVAGVMSHHSNYHEDRRFRFRCCPLSSGSLRHCHLTSYINDWDAYMDYNVPGDSVIRGFRSHHRNYYEDRRWQVSVCRT